MTLTRELAAPLREWCDSRRPFALATVFATTGSAPGPPGTLMAVDGAGEVLGSLSGGCVEGAVYETAREVLRLGTATVQHFGYTAEDAVDVGLTCGGSLDVVVQRADPSALGVALDAVATQQGCAVVTVVGGAAPLGASLTVLPSSSSGALGTPGLDAVAADDARGMLAAGITGTRTYGRHGERRLAEVTVLVASHLPPPRLLVFGATDFAAALSRIGGFLGYRVTVCDARPVFATPRRFPAADDVVCDWPHRYLQGTQVDSRTAICVLTHDPKFDVPLLETALRGPAGYVGAMGSRRTHADRTARLVERGLTAEELGRLRSPIGLDLGARTPEETALSIAAELVQERWGGTGVPLRETHGALHRGAAATS